MSLYAVVPQFKKMLENLERWLDKGVEYAEQKKFDPELLLAARLRPDQYPLLKQVQAACDAAKFGAARPAGKEPPKHPDTEQNLDEIRTRLHSVIAYLDDFKPEDFEGADERLLELPFLEGKLIRGEDYIAEMAAPNFYFHVVTAYAILRYAGVELGKRNFIGTLTLRDK